MRHVKSERLKKLETELNDLQQWLKLGLVPKKDIDKHQEEIRAVDQKIQEEKERLQFLKESGDMDELVVPKRTPPRAGYTEMPTIPDMDISETNSHAQESAFDVESEANDSGSTVIEEKAGTEDEAAADDDGEDKEEESYFSDKNRWRRGGIVDPEADEW